MINEKELRIGNWVYAQSRKLVKNKSLPTKIKVVTPQDRHNNRYDPIPLTPAILEKAGFEYANDPDFDKYADAKVYFKGPLQIGCRKENDDYLRRHVAYYFGYPTATKNTIYLHSLQNLYFALTGEELTINL